MKYKGTILTAASGKVGGLVFSHNKGGVYVRNLAIPVNPGSPQQEVVRAATAFLTDYWSSGLTNSQRDEWTAYAEAVPLPNSLGDPVNIPPLAMYVRSNVPRIQTGLPRVDDGPSLLTLGAFTPPTFAAPDATADEVDVSFDDGDAWANEDDSAMLVYCSRGQSPTINFFKGPYRYAGRIDGDSVTPPTSPATITLPFSVVAAQKVFFRVRVSRADGRLAADFRNVAVAA